MKKEKVEYPCYQVIKNVETNGSFNCGELLRRAPVSALADQIVNVAALGAIVAAEMSAGNFRTLYDATNLSSRNK